MMDWGMALSVGLAVVIISELTILGAIILPKVPLEPGKTWRGTVKAVSGISLIIGGAAGYVAGQFGGRGGGGATTAGQSVVSTQPIQQVPVASNPAKVEPTKPADVSRLVRRLEEVGLRLERAGHRCSLDLKPAVV